MITKYKVVKNRRSCIIPPRTKYCLRYVKDTIVTSLVHTTGIMVFGTKKQAKDFIFANAIAGAKIIKVKPIGRRLKLKLISPIQTGYETKLLNRFYHCPKEYGYHFFPDGTQCYAAVKVLT